MDQETEITKVFRLSPLQKKGLEKIKIKTIKDLLFYFPVRYSHISEITRVENVLDKEIVTIYGVIEDLEMRKSFTTKKMQAEAKIKDIKGNTLYAIWFNQHYIAKMYHVGQKITLTGKAQVKNGKKTIINGEIDTVEHLPIDGHDSLFAQEKGENQFGYPIYPETKGVTSKWIYYAVRKILVEKVHEKLTETISENILKKYNLPKLSTALYWIHMPQSENHATAAKKRFAFEEIYTLQIARQYDKLVLSKEKAYTINTADDTLDTFLNTFPFKKTNAQIQAIKTIVNDLRKSTPMSRLLEGDVGSGKTLVAAAACFAVINTRPKMQNFGTLQVAYMAPTEILAIQHFENFIEYFVSTGIQIGLMTSSGCRKFPSKVATKNGKATWTTISRSQLVKWVAQGEIAIVIGTHALIQKSLVFKHLGLVIIDEQHRFGARQRALLAKKDGFLPHLLSMSATPIPRTLALTLYGDLDLSVLDELPAGRKKVITQIVYPQDREKTYEEIKKELKKKHQLYIICPRIDEPDEDKRNTLLLRSVTSEAARLKKDVFPGENIGILHSKMTKEKKEKVMADFYEGRLSILVATSVIEVGVNIPNATTIIIEGGERFGLSQLHQLRGRVQRSSDQAYCYIFADAKTDKTKERLNYFIKAKDGFELAEYDLLLRGTGELTGMKQSGISDIGMEAIKNIKLVEAARNEAVDYIQENNIPEIQKMYHFE